MPVITCDQAIFTSVRGLMGEGYRIIAASRGLKAQEKQAITQRSPSHEALCLPPGSSPEQAIKHHTGRRVAGAPGSQKRFAVAAKSAKNDYAPAAGAFYALPTGRLCVAYSCYAGAEHTGRGGQRVYTHNVIFDATAFRKCRYNPCNVLRAMQLVGLTRPQLTPGSPLPEVRLDVDEKCNVRASAVRVHQHLLPVLEALFDRNSVVINTIDGWLDSAEALMLSLPGPLRSTVAFSAGLRFSMGRSHNMQILFDDRDAVRSRLVSRSARYFDCTARERPATTIPRSESYADPDSAWFTFVVRHWKKGDFGGLAGRTSKDFSSVSVCDRERIGRLYNHMDGLPEAQTTGILTIVTEYLEGTFEGVEEELRTELVSTARKTLSERFTCAAWPEAKGHWPAVVSLWRRSANGTAFAQPLIGHLLQRAMSCVPMEAAEAALDVARDLPHAVDKKAHEALLDEVLGRLAGWVATRVLNPQGPDATAESDQLHHLQALCEKWRTLKPDCAAIQQITDHLQRLAQLCSSPTKS